MAGSGCALRRSSTRRITQRKASFEEMPLEVPASASSPPYDKVRLPGQSFGEAGMQPDFLRRFLDLKIVLKRIGGIRSEEHTSELQSLRHLVCRLLLEKKKYN